MNKKQRLFWIVYITFVTVLYLTTAAFADYGWMTPINQIKTSLVKVEYDIAFIAVIGCGTSLVFGDGNINGFIRQCVFIAAVISLVLFADKVVGMIQTNSSTYKGESTTKSSIVVIYNTVRS